RVLADDVDATASSGSLVVEDDGVDELDPPPGVDAGARPALRHVPEQLARLDAGDAAGLVDEQAGAARGFVVPDGHILQDDGRGALVEREAAIAVGQELGTGDVPRRAEARTHA